MLEATKGLSSASHVVKLTQRKRKSEGRNQDKYDGGLEIHSSRPLAMNLTKILEKVRYSKDCRDGVESGLEQRPSQPCEQTSYGFGQASLRMNEWHGSHRMTHRRIARNTKSDSLSKSPHHSQRIPRQLDCCMAYPCRCHFVHARSGSSHSCCLVLAQ